MTTRIYPAETYYRAFFKIVLCMLPYALAFIYITLILIIELKHYLLTKLNEFFNSLILLFNCLIEDGEGASSFETQPEIESNQVDECKTTKPGTCMTVVKRIDSFSNSPDSSQKFDDSMSDIEILRGDSDEETENEKEKELAEIIEVKRVLIQNKRQELCGRLLACKLMEFQEDYPSFNANHSINLPIPTESPIKIAEEIHVHQIPALPASPLLNSSPFIPEDKESCTFSSEGVLTRAIQASMDDLAAKQVRDSILTPPQEQASTEVVDNNTSASSLRKVNQQQNTPTRDNLSQLMPTPVINFSDSSKNNYPQYLDDTGTQRENEENMVVEDFMEGDRYVGDKGKRPLSERYAYKKRVKSNLQAV